MFLEPFLNSLYSVARNIVLLKEATAIREYYGHEGVYLISIDVMCQIDIHMAARPWISQQNLVQNIILFPLDCLRSTVHPAAITFPGR